jgi:Subtilase family
MPRRPIRRSLALVALLAAPVRAGTLSDELHAMMESADPATRIPVVMELAEQVDVAAAVEGLEGKSVRVPVLVDALRAKAAATQDAGGCDGGLLSELRAQGPDRARNLRSFWVVNAVAVEATKDVIAACAARPDVGIVVHDRALERAAVAPAAVAGFDVLAAIRAREAQALGTGAGTIVGLIGTGADPLHPALAGGLLARADGSPIWKDAVAGLPAPYDDVGEGTHLLGVAVGRPVGGTEIGVAPGAGWIACKGLTASGGPQGGARLLACLQFMLNPDDPGPPDPAHVPDVVLAPWWFDDPGVCDPFLVDRVRVLRAAGILPVFASGHDTVAPGTPAPADALPYPASYPEAFSVGASSDTAPAALLPTSYRGAAGCRKPGDEVPPNRPDRWGPQVFAPGVGVLSAWPGGGYRVLEDNPEGVAAAEVAGAAALLLSVAPTLDPDQIEAAIQRTALGYEPGLPPPAPVPAYRAGLLDVLAAVTLEDAAFTAQTSPPPDSVTDTPVAATVTMTNTGVTTWLPGTHALLALAPGWGAERVELPGTVPCDGSSAPVLPGRKATFCWSPVAPHLPGAYAFQWRMANGAVPFGEASERVTVPVVGTDVAIYQGRTLSPLVPGGSAWADVSFRNVGTNTWTRGRYTLGEVDGVGWAPYSVDLLGDTPPGTVGTFRGFVTAPRIQGTYDFQWVMRKDGVSLGIYTPNERIAIAGVDGATLESFVPAPWEMRAGTSAMTAITFRNTGTNAWTWGYCLRAREWWYWSAAAVCLAPGEVILPGVARTFTGIVTAPDGRERRALAWDLVGPANVPFGSAAVGTVGIPWDIQASVSWSRAPGVQGNGADFWFFRRGVAIGWAKMVWAGDHWKNAGDPLSAVWPASAHPASGPGGVLGRFWKSPVAGRVRVSGVVSRRADHVCGDGVRVRVEWHSEQFFDAQPLFTTVIPSNDWSPHAFGLTTTVAVNDTIRFVVEPRTDNPCDGTNLDPLVQVLPPDGIGPVPAAQSVNDLAYEVP